MAGTVKVLNVRVCGYWLPCEFESHRAGALIRCLGDVDSADLQLRQRADSLADAAQAYFDAIPEDRKLVVLVPQDDVPDELWPCRQVLKKTLLAEIQRRNEVATHAADA